MIPENEKQLVLACQRNDPKAQTAFYNLYKGRLLGVCRRYARTEAEAEVVASRKRFADNPHAVDHVGDPDHK